MQAAAVIDLSWAITVSVAKSHPQQSFGGSAERGGGGGGGARALPRFSIKLLVMVSLAILAGAMWRIGGVRAICDYAQRDFGAEWIMRQDDLIELARYRDANRALIASNDARPRIVLMGDSITFRWEAAELPAAPGLNLVNRGIPGQHSEPDAAALRERRHRAQASRGGAARREQRCASL